MANYNSMKKEELIKALKERDAAIAGLQETNKLLSKENDELTVKVQGLTDDLKKSNEICERLAKEKDALRIEKNAAKTMVEQKEDIISTLKRQRVILGIITIAAILIAIIF